MRRMMLAVALLVVLGGAAGLAYVALSDEETTPVATRQSSTTSSMTSSPAGAAGTSDEPEQVDTPSPEPSYEPVFEDSSCAFERPLGFRVECGYLVVPEDRDEPDGRQVRLHVALFPSSADDPAADPVVYLDGGPGGEPLDTLQFGFEERFAPFLETRDVIIFDQRGTGWSDPALNCPQYRELSLALLDDDLDSDEYIELEVEVLDDCRSDWASEGIDLANFTSLENAADVADLRVALDYESWNLYGISYGTRLALTVMRDHPEGIRSVVLDSTYPPEADGVLEFAVNARRGFDRLFDGCAADAECESAYGDIETRLYDAVAGWDREPRTVPIVDLFSGGRYDALVDGDDLLGAVFQSLYSETLIPSLPKLIDEVDRGEVGLLSQTLSLFLANGEFFSPGMYFSVQCNEEVPFADSAAYPAAVADLPYMAILADSTIIQSDRAFEFCAEWGSGTAAGVENQPVRSQIPTLVMAGVYDPITPPADGRAVADQLANGVYVEFEGLGHGVSTAGDCPLAIMLEFLDAPVREPDLACIEDLSPPAWELPLDLGSGGEEVQLVAFAADPFGLAFEGVAPQGWEEQFAGTFARQATALDQSAIIIQGYPGEFAGIVADQLLGSLSLERETEDLSPFDDGGREWAWYRNATLGTEIDILAIDLDGNTFMVMLLSAEAEREGLIDSVLRPVAASLQASE